MSWIGKLHIFPQTPDFFAHFEQLTHVIGKASDHLCAVTTAGNTMATIARKVQKLEHQADEITHTIAQNADSTFITPIDREDIHDLADHLDNLIDLIENVTTALTLYQIKGRKDAFSQYATLICSTIGTIETLIGDLKHRGQTIPQMRQAIAIIHAKEKEADILTRQVLGNLFKKKNAVEIIKWKYIYDNLEMIMDECERVADTVDEIIIKNF